MRARAARRRRAVQLVYTLHAATLSARMLSLTRPFLASSLTSSATGLHVLHVSMRPIAMCTGECQRCVNGNCYTVALRPDNGSPILLAERIMHRRSRITCMHLAKRVSDHASWPIPHGRDPAGSHGGVNAGLALSTGTLLSQGRPTDSMCGSHDSCPECTQRAASAPVHASSQ